jgi:hypothetical protein
MTAALAELRRELSYDRRYPPPLPENPTPSEECEASMESAQLIHEAWHRLVMVWEVRRQVTDRRHLRAAA